MKNIIEQFRDELSRWMLHETHVPAGPVDEQRVALYAADWAVHVALRSQIPNTWRESAWLSRTPHVTSAESATATHKHLAHDANMLHQRAHLYIRVFNCLDTVTRPRLCLAHVADVARALESEELAEQLLRGMVSL